MAKREILFRGKVKGTGEWVYGNLIHRVDESPVQESNELYISDYICEFDAVCLVYEVDSDTVGQYTGMKDKNGKEIYEGDILKTPRGFIGQVVFGRVEEECKHREHGRMITDVYTTYGWCFRRADGYICAIDDSILSGELIGNIYDSPNLMRNCKEIQG